MTMKILLLSLATMTLTTSSALAVLKIQTFETAPRYEEADYLIDPTNCCSVLDPGEWGTLEDGTHNTDPDLDGDTSDQIPMWNSGGWIQPIGFETADDNLGPVGPNAEGLASTAVKTSVFTGVIVQDNTSWGDVSTATHITMDVKGSFAGSGGINVLVYGDGGFFWSWGAAATDLAVGANPGDVTEWTTITIPINKPEIQSDGAFPALPGEEGAGGNWGTWQSFVDDQEMSDIWDSVFASVDQIDVRGVTPDTQVDNLGFILPDVGLPGDFDADADVDGSDFLVWQQGFGSTHDANDLADWETNFGTIAAAASIGAVPEPSTIGLALVAGWGMLCARRKHGS